jgi:hypothetical protein
MTELQKEFEATGYSSWINSDLYPDGRIYTQEYTQWLEKRIEELTKKPYQQEIVLLISNETDMTIESAWRNLSDAKDECDRLSEKKPWNEYMVVELKVQ